MTRASISRLTTAAGAGTPALEIIAGASKGLWLLQIDLTLAAATASVYAIGRPAAKGLTPTAPVLFLPTFSADPSTLQAATALAWATPPTSPVNFYRKANLPATIGAQAIFAFSTGLWISPGSTFVLWNVGATNSVVDVNVIVDENN